ncbi:hypothetical protein [Helicobacter himalayensis]|uniref:hypothetical protein n=1 Tax=Helicobacter himalayensis TaxID=1591088 RepID=UPI000829FE42|nr:hypothetical protein [Helicobacter himalayensis]
MSKRDYNDMVSKTIEVELQNPRLKALLYNRVQNAKYDEAEALLCKLPQRFSYQSIYSSCKGQGN